MQYKVFIDGKEGTTGLRLYDRLCLRKDIEILTISEELHRDKNERKRLINQSDFTFLCLPDDAAREAVLLCENENVRIIDASTAHRTAEGWAYGLPELSKKHRDAIKNSKRVSVPGCYAGGFVAIAYPLVELSVIEKDHAVYCHAVSGYSGAGKAAIAMYEGENKPHEYNSPRQYALSQEHKHLKEMQKQSGLTFSPMFNPIVDDYYNGMVVSVPIIARTLQNPCTAKELWQKLCDYYKAERLIKVMPFMGEGALENGFLAANTLANSNEMHIFVCGNDERILIASQLDNLGKGASGAAVQCMNIMMGIDETTGLV